MDHWSWSSRILRMFLTMLVISLFPLSLPSNPVPDKGRHLNPRLPLSTVHVPPSIFLYNDLYLNLIHSHTKSIAQCRYLFRSNIPVLWKKRRLDLQRFRSMIHNNIYEHSTWILIHTESYIAFLIFFWGKTVLWNSLQVWDRNNYQLHVYWKMKASESSLGGTDWSSCPVGVLLSMLSTQIFVNKTSTRKVT